MLSIYKASAGSGKTFTLAYEYIKMLLGYKDMASGRYRLNRGRRDRHRHILAVTFTNKATDEMKRRIVHELAVLAGMEPGWNEASPYLERLTKEFGCSPEDLKKASASALRQLLFDFNFFQVSTIDSFFQTILRSFAREVEISGNYEVDLDNDRAIGQGVRELFDSLVIDSKSQQTARIVKWIIQYLLGELKSGRQVSLFNRSSRIHAKFLGFIKNISNDDFAENYDKMMEYLSDPDRLQRLANSLKESEEIQKADSRRLCGDALTLIRARGYDTDPKLRLNNHVMKQLTAVAESGEASGATGSVEKVLNNIDNAYLKTLRDSRALNPDPELDRAVEEACRSIVEGASNLKLNRSISKNLFVLGLIERVYYHINRYRNDNNTILLSDTNQLLREIIGEEKDNGAPFVYERVGVWINHYLIDEFQDTSRLQWENLSPLLHQGLSNGEDSLIIGDEKQCIYRFRFSDPTLLQSEVGHHFSDYSVVRGDDPAENTNWRSSADVVRFNNDLFGVLASATGFDDIYANVCQNVAPKHMSHGGYVQFSEINIAKGEEEDSRTMSLEIMRDNIIRQLRAGYLPSEITVLTRFNAEAADVISYLMDIASDYPELRNVRIMSDDAMSVDSAPAVRLIVSVMRFLSTPEADTDQADGDSHSRARMREISKMINRFEHIMSHSEDAGDALRTAIALRDTQLSVESGIADDMACLNVPSLVERIIGRYISPEVASQQNMYISAFVDVVTEFCSRGSADVQKFLEWWDESGHRSKISAPFDENAIRIMTIHKSKGLEFRCVHIPFANWKMVDFRDLEWFPTGNSLPGIDSSLVPPMIPLIPEQALVHTQFGSRYEQRCREQRLDELNVLYVALTRAVDELSVCYKASDSDGDFVNEKLGTALNLMEMETLTSDEQPEKVTVRYRGKPTVVQKRGEAHRTALEPENSLTMMPYATADRDDLWSKLDIDRYLDYGKARERGIVLHDVLAHIHRSADIDKAVGLCSYRGRLPKDEADEVSRFLQKELNRDDVSRWFDGFKRALRERPLVLNDGSVCRPDRVVWTADGHVDVVDYKFGSERPKAYARQVSSYISALRRQGCRNLRGFIWYVDSGKIVEVTD